MANILTEEEAANVLRCDEDDEAMLDLLPLVDAYVETATGRDWTADSDIYPQAKAAARMLLVRWHEDPGAMAAEAALGFGLPAALVQLKALALELSTLGVPAEALALLASQPASGAANVATGANLILVFNHEMAGTATSAVTLKNAAGASVASSKTLDVTGKILTVRPTLSLSAGANYTIEVADAADIYGQTLETEIGFTTA
jgi:hypothetical protein